MLITNLLGRRLLDSTGTSSGECVGVTDSGNGETLVILHDSGTIQFLSILEATFDMQPSKPIRKATGNK